MQRVTTWQLKQRQGLPLEIKVRLSLSRIRQWYQHWGGEIYVSFSGGMDSTVMLHLARSIYPDIPAVCVDAQLFPETRKHVRGTPNVTIIRPEKSFPRVIEQYGYPVVSKRMAQYIHEVQNAKGETATKRLRLTGIKSNGEFSKLGMISRKWRYLCNAPFRISDRSCHWLKKKPLIQAGKQFGYPLIGIRVDEGQQREQTYYTHGCNAFHTKHPRSWPIAFWSNDDVWEYVRQHAIPYSPVYDMGYTRTGCMFCAFGAHLEKPPNRFQRMAKTHPKHWDYCMNRLEMAKVLQYIGVEYEPSRQLELPFMETCITEEVWA